MAEKTTDEMILDIWQTIPAIKDMKHTLYGNGQPGLVKEFIIVKSQQEQCPARQNAGRDNRMFAIGIFACCIAFISGVGVPVVRWVLSI